MNDSRDTMNRRKWVMLLIVVILLAIIVIAVLSLWASTFTWLEY